MQLKRDVFKAALTWALEEFELGISNKVNEVLDLIDMDHTYCEVSYKDGQWKLYLDFNGDYELTITSDEDAASFAYYITKIFSTFEEDSRKESFINTFELLLRLLVVMSIEDKDKEMEDLSLERQNMYELIQTTAQSLLGTKDARVRFHVNWKKANEGEFGVDTYEVCYHRSRLVRVEDKDPRKCAEKLWEARFAG